MMKNLTLALITLLLFACKEKTIQNENISLVQEIPNLTSSLSEAQISKLDSLNINFQLRGNCYAYSSNKNAQESNGEVHSGNLPKMVDNKFPRNGLYLVINENEQIKIDSTILGCRLYLINTSDSLTEINASDSRLNIVAEALNENKKWSPISFLPSSGCGNSYHTVKLDENEYWNFDIPIFKGTMKTKIRYVLKIDKDNKIVSNVIEAYLNPKQFDSEYKQGYENINIMDPYSE
jgi:hypothetical protein